MARALTAIPLLTLIYALALNSFKLWDLAIGALVSAVLIGLTWKQVFVGERTGPLRILRRFIAFFPFAAAVLVDIIKGTWTVALVSLKIKPLPQCGMVLVPIGERTPLGVAITGLVTTLSPGSVLIEVDDERRAMVFHVFDVTDPDKEREQHQAFYERYQRHVFP